MKLRKLTFCCCATLMVLLCACEKQVRYENALPQDAALVVQADFAAMVDKSGLNRDEGKKVVRHLADVLKSGMDGADGLIDKIMDNPDESGLELSEKVYFFAEPKSERIGLLSKVSDKDKLKDLLKALQRQGICEDIHKGDGCSWSVMGNVLLAYSSSAMLAIADPKGDEARDNLHAAEKLLRQTDGEGFTATDNYAEMMKKEGDLLAFVSLNILPASLPSLVTMGLSAELNLADVKYVASLDFASGKAVLDVTSITTDAVVMDLIGKQQKAVSPLKGKYLDAFPANTLFWMSGNADGATVYSLLCENPIVRQQLENPLMPIDIERIFSAIKGDMALAFTDLSGQHFIAYADVTCSDFLQTFEDIKPVLAMTGGMFKLINDGTDAYEFRMPKRMGGVFSRIWFGVKDGRLYVTNDKDLIGARVLGLSLRANPWGKQVEGKTLYMALNANVIHQTFSEMMSEEGMAAKLLGILAGLDYLTVESPEGVDYHAELVMKDKAKNFLQYLWQN